MKILIEESVLRQAIKTLERCYDFPSDQGLRIEGTITALRTALDAAEKVEPVHVGDSAFEQWFQAQPFATQGVKQIARDAYAAGMSDPLTHPAPAVPEVTEGVTCGEPVPWNVYANLLVEVAAAKANAVHEGWQLVPKEPTHEMRVEALLARDNGESVTYLYKAMLAAAPTQGEVK